MNLRTKFTALGAFFVLAVSVAACGGSIPGNSVAVMAGNPITTAAFNHWMYVAAKGNSAQSVGAPVIVPNDPPNFSSCVAQVRRQIPALAKTPDKTIRSDCKQLFTSLSSQVMNFLITSYWYQAQAHKLGIKVSPAEVASALAAARHQSFPTSVQFNAFLKATGQTLQDINYRLRISKIYQKLLVHYGKKITPATIAAYYASHPTEFGTPESRNLRIVRTNSQAQAAAALAALKAGQSWDTVAKQYSVDTATKNNGGQLQGVVNGEEEHALNQVAFEAPVGKVVGPVHGTFGWYVVEVSHINPAKRQTLAKAQKLIREILTSTNQTAAQTTLNKDVKANWGSQTQCRSEYSMILCSGYKAPKTTTSAVPTTPSTAPSTTTTPTSTGSSTATTSSTTSTSSG
jgi:parvulin-like peptidyl-prolyl isomerase